MYLFCAALDVLRGEEGQLFEVRVLGPHGLGDHLSQLHSCQCRTQPAVTGQHINAGLDQANRLQRQHLGQIHTHRNPIRKCNSSITNNLHLAQDLLRVRLQLSAQLHPGQVGLQQQVGLHVGIVELGVVQFVRHFLCQLKHKKKLFPHDQFQCADLTCRHVECSCYCDLQK